MRIVIIGTFYTLISCSTFFIFFFNFLTSFPSLSFSYVVSRLLAIKLSTLFFRVSFSVLSCKLLYVKTSFLNKSDVRSEMVSLSFCFKDFRRLTSSECFDFWIFVFSKCLSMSFSAFSSFSSKIKTVFYTSQVQLFFLSHHF